ncbi:MAG: hypothetical protein IT204_05345 [Fimbriimonadaceae bacterium]|nr:hypothetical protein [Fimbriimonadaceae bacterium]
MVLWRVILICWLAGGPALAALDDVSVSVEARNQPLRALLAAIGQQAKLTLILDDRVPDVPISLDLRDQPLNKALDLICRGIDLVWEPIEGGALVTIDPRIRQYLDGLGDVPAAAVKVPVNLLTRPVTVGLENVPLPDAAATLQRLSGTRLALDPTAPTGLRVTASFYQAPLIRCLGMLCQAAGLYLRVDPGQILRLVSPDRVIVLREGLPQPQMIEQYPANFRGPLADLLVPTVFTNPARFGLKLRSDSRGWTVCEPLGTP